MIRYLKIAFERLVYSNIYIAIASTLLCWETFLIYNVPVQPNISALRLVFFSTLFAYNFQRLARIDIRFDSASQRTAWIVNQSLSLKIITLFSLLGILESVRHFSVEVIAFLAPLGMVSIAYALKVLKWNEKKLRLREVPFLKIFLIALTWSLATVIFPLLTLSNFYFDDNLGSISLLFLQRFIFIFAITLPFDIRDFSYDALSGLKTIPSRIGTRNTVILAIVMLVCYVFLIGVHFLCFNVLEMKNFIAFLISAFIAMVVVLFSSSNRPELFFSGLIDGLIIVQFLLFYGLNE